MADWGVKDIKEGDVFRCSLYGLKNRHIAISDGYKFGYSYVVRSHRVNFRFRNDYFSLTDVKENAFFYKYPSSQDKLFARIEKEKR